MIKEAFILTWAFPKYIEKGPQETLKIAEDGREWGGNSFEAFADTIRYYAKTTERLNAELREKDRQLAESEQVHKVIRHTVELEKPPDGVEERRHCMEFIKKVLGTS